MYGFVGFRHNNVSKSDILGPMDYLSDIEQFGIVWKGYVWR